MQVQLYVTGCHIVRPIQKQDPGKTTSAPMLFVEHFKSSPCTQSHLAPVQTQTFTYEWSTFQSPVINARISLANCVTLIVVHWHIMLWFSIYHSVVLWSIVVLSETIDSWADTTPHPGLEWCNCINGRQTTIEPLCIILWHPCGWW